MGSSAPGLQPTVGGMQVKLDALCVYCGSSSRGAESHKAAARRLGQLLGQSGIKLVYGGGRVGLMGMVADAALAAGGEVIGVIPRFLDEYEIGHTKLTRLEIVDSMHERKALMAQLSAGFVILPGGLGTLDETFEIVTWKQLGLHDKPIVVVDVDGYWTPLKQLVDGIVTNGYARPENAALATFVDAVDDVLPALLAMPEPSVSLSEKWL